VNETNQVVQLKRRIAGFVQQKNYKQALNDSNKLVKLAPVDIEAWYVRHQLQEYFGDFEGAVRSLHQVCQVPSPIYEAALDTSVKLCKKHKLNQLGVAPAQARCKNRPHDPEMFFDLGYFLFELEQMAASVEPFSRALEMDPSSERYARFLTAAYLFSGQVVKSLEILDAYTERYGNSEEMHAIQSMTSNYPWAFTDQAVFDRQVASGRFFESGHDVSDRFIGFTPGEKIRLGYLSSDFYHHSVAFFFRTLCEHHNRDRFEVVCFSDVARPDQVTDDLRALSDEWVECLGKDDSQVASLVRERNIDILVDLIGYAGRSRLGVFARRAAPVQVSYLGYPNTTGLKRMDYRICDSFTDPPGDSDAMHTETLKRLKSGFLCYTNWFPVPAVGELPAQKNNGSVCFGSFNSFMKVSDELLRLWADVLKQVPGSCLLMKSKPLVEAAQRERVWSVFESAGIDRSRVRLMGWAPTIGSHLELYNEVDIHLDTFPYNGTTTTVESLRQGVPTVTLAGRSHRSRVGLSLLTQLGLEGCVAHSEADYIAKAVGLAQDIKALAETRRSLRGQVDRSSLCDQNRFIGEIEQVYEEMLTERAEALKQ